MIRDERHSQVYRKANSFVAIKHDAFDAEKVLGRVREFCLERQTMECTWIPRADGCSSLQ